MGGVVATHVENVFQPLWPLLLQVRLEHGINVLSLLDEVKTQNTVSPLYTNTQYIDTVHYNDNMISTKPLLNR